MPLPSPSGSARRWYDNRIDQEAVTTVSIYDVHEEQYTLAQFARRVGISEGRARAMLAAGDRLPRPDVSDADGRPMWRQSTIDRWCRRVGRPVPKDAKGVASWQDASEPAPVMFCGEVLVRSRPGRPFRVHVVVWDTPDGHLVQITRFDLEWVDNRIAATAAAQVLEPAFWSDAVIIFPLTGIFGGDSYDHYSGDVYRLQPSLPAHAGGRRLFTLLKAPADDESGPPEPADVPVEYAGLCHSAEIERVIGRPMPMWLDGSCTPEAARRLTAFGLGATFTVPDTTTPWPQTRERIAAAFEWGMRERFPQAFRLVALDALGTLEDVRDKHVRQKERGEGWYLVARPARPDWPITLETAATEAAQSEPDLAAAAIELEKLRPLEAQEPYPSTLGEVLFEATRELGWLLQKHRPELVFDAVIRQGITSAGPVVEQWRQTLVPLTDIEVQGLIGSRRIARLLSPDISARTESEFKFVEKARRQVVGIWRDYAGRLTVETIEESWDGHPLLELEWPMGLPADWNEHTIIAADPEADVGAVFALTPMQDGTLRADPLPNPGSDPSYTWGYSGTGPSNLYDALVRCALGIWASSSADNWLRKPAPHGSELWHYITTRKESPIRLPWPQVQAWARADRKRALS
jgi:hypothetical protein